MLGYFVILFVAIFGLNGAARASSQQIDWLAKGWPRTLMKVESFALPISAKDVRSLVYGNSTYGFFSLTQPRISGKTISIEFFPPGYRHPIEFYVEAGSDQQRKRHRLGQRSYKSPFTDVGEAKATVRGKLSRPFISLSFPIGANNKDRNGSSVPAIINSQGEMVWAAPLAVHGELPKFSVALSKIGPREFLAMGTHAGAGVWRLDSGGNILSHFDPTTLSKPIFFHHIFNYLKDTNELLAFTHECRTLSLWNEFIPWLQGPRGWWRRLFLPRRSYMGSRLIKLNLSSDKFKTIWTSFDSSSPARSPNLSVSAVYMDRFIDVRDPDQYRALLIKPAYTEKLNGLNCDVDWSHENSVRYYPGKGYLVSQRNLNRILMIDEQGRVLWSMGEGADNTYALPPDGKAFSMQHDAWLLEDNRILLFDNSASYRGYSGRREHRSRLQIYQLDDTQARLSWNFNIPLVYTELRGSVTPLPDDRLFVYQPGGARAPYFFFEVSQKKNKMIARLKLNNYSDQQRSIEARPLDSIMDETFLGYGAELEDGHFLPEVSSPEEGY